MFYEHFQLLYKAYINGTILNGDSGTVFFIEQATIIYLKMYLFHSKA